MKALFLFIFSVSLHAYAQDSAPLNKINVGVISPLSFTFSNAMELLNPKIISNALQLSVNVEQQNLNVYAQTSFSENELNSMKLLSLKLAGKTSPDAGINTETVALSDIPALLFTQPRCLEGSKQYLFYYDLIMNPVQNMIPPGNYQFSINFTITAQ